MKNKQPKIIFWDIETSFIEVRTFGLYQDITNHKSIIKDWYIICASWIELNKKQAKAVSIADNPKMLKNNNDYEVVKKLREVLEDCDILIAHNGDKFDLKKFNARLVYHNLDPLPTIKTIDTLKEVKKIGKFTSNRLDYLAKYLGLEGKLNTEDGLWENACNGDEVAIKKMVKYNKQDVYVLRDVYLRLKRYMKGSPILSSGFECPNCGSSHLQKRGLSISKVCRYQRYQCQECGTWSRERLSTVDYEKPQLLYA